VRFTIATKTFISTKTSFDPLATIDNK